MPNPPAIFRSAHLNDCLFFISVDIAPIVVVVFPDFYWELDIAPTARECSTASWDIELIIYRL